jgi:hypothetical protein
MHPLLSAPKIVAESGSWLGACGWGKNVEILLNLPLFSAFSGDSPSFTIFGALIKVFAPFWPKSLSY